MRAESERSPRSPAEYTRGEKLALWLLALAVAVPGLMGLAYMLLVWWAYRFGR